MTPESAQEQRMHRDIAKFFGHFRNLIYSVKAFEGGLLRQQCIPRCTDANDLYRNALRNDDSKVAMPEVPHLYIRKKKITVVTSSSQYWKLTVKPVAISASAIQQRFTWGTI